MTHIHTQQVDAGACVPLARGGLLARWPPTTTTHARANPAARVAVFYDIDQGNKKSLAHSIAGAWANLPCASRSVGSKAATPQQHAAMQPAAGQFHW